MGPIIRDSRILVETGRLGLEYRAAIEDETMRWSITIGGFGGRRSRSTITFTLFLVRIAFSGWSRGGAAAALDSTPFIVLLFA